MKLVRFTAANRSAAVGILTRDGVRPADETDMVALISAGELPRPSGPAVTDYRLLAPVPRPGKIFGSGINYASHKEENPDAVMPEEPGFFAKFASAVCGPGDPIRLATPSSNVDYEVELAVVIGRPGRDIDRGSAMRHVFGYTVINDVSDRGVQFRPHQLVLGKGFDSFCPMGPVLVTADELPELDGLTVQSHVNGELRQNATAGEMIFDVPALIAHASQNITLEPGDVITTGTPAGCGTFRSPPVWLQPGDIVDVAVEGIGTLSNPVVAGWPASG
jgi:2-keto-4-pentenoate hydratase/2-oxohepta-3-ene-1,7-dioic acid hydratase in catechol pathway